MVATVLRKIDQTRNMARFYEIEVQPGLFGDVSVTRHWGRIGSNGQAKEHWFSTAAEAAELANKMARQKVRRGYSSPLTPG
jgi:predicted DNA-binding WGR domain protein